MQMAVFPNKCELLENKALCLIHTFQESKTVCDPKQELNPLPPNQAELTILSLETILKSYFPLMVNIL